MNIIANNDKTVTTAKTDLYFFKLLYLLSFKKSNRLRKHLVVIQEELEAIKNRRVY